MEGDVSYLILNEIEFLVDRRFREVKRVFKIIKRIHRIIILLNMRLLAS